MEITSVASCLKQVQLDQVAQSLVWLCFECLQGWKFHSLFGHLFQCLITQLAKENFHMASWHFFVLQLVSIASCLPISKSLDQSSLFPAIRYLQTAIGSFFLHCEQTVLSVSPRTPGASAPSSSCWPFCWTCSSMSVSYWGVLNWMQYSTRGLKMLNRGE